MKLKEIITNVFTSKAKKAEAKRIAEEAEAQKQAKEAEARKKAEEAEAKRQAEEAAARKKVEEEEAKRKAFLDKPYKTLMPMVTKSLETTGKMTSEEISSLLQLDRDEKLLTFGLINGNFVFKTGSYDTNNFHVVKDNHLLTISTEYSPQRTVKRRIPGSGYYGFYRDSYSYDVISSQHSLAFSLDNATLYEGKVYDFSGEDYAGISQHFDFDSNMKGLFDKITFPGKDIKSKMTNPKDISRQDGIEQQLSQSLTKYKNKQEENALEEKKQKELEIIAREKAAQEREMAEKQEQEKQRAKAQKDRLEQNPALKIFLDSKTGHGK